MKRSKPTAASDDSTPAESPSVAETALAELVDSELGADAGLVDAEIMDDEIADVSLPGLAAAANRYHAQAQAAAHSFVEGVWHAGNALNAAKSQLRHLEWLPWLAANFNGDSSTAQRYMLIAKSCTVQDLESFSSMREALKAISVSKHAPVEPQPGEGDTLLDAAASTAIESTLEQRGNVDDTRRIDGAPWVSDLDGEPEQDAPHPAELTWARSGVMSAADWLRILASAREFVGTDRTVPTFARVRLEATDSSVIAVATDRFVFGADRADYDGDPFCVTIDIDRVDALIGAAKDAHYDLGQPQQVMVGVGGNTFHCCFFGGESLSVPLPRQDFPDYRQLIPGAAEMENDGVETGILLGETGLGATAGVLRLLHESRSSNTVVMATRRAGLLLRSTRRPFSGPGRGEDHAFSRCIQDGLRRAEPLRRRSHHRRLTAPRTGHLGLRNS
jgi:hypothetical protein